MALREASFSEFAFGVSFFVAKGVLDSKTRWLIDRFFKNHDGNF